MNIIAVDDEEGALYGLVSAIKKVEPNATVYKFLSPQEAYGYAKDCLVDVAFLDIEMPAMTGIELAKMLKAVNPKINVIFTTAHSEYGVAAVRLRTSGYLLKPVKTAEIRRELDELRFPVEIIKGLRAVTFGQFDLYMNNQPVHFSRSKSKELLAYLIDRNGGGCTKKELHAVLFEDGAYDNAVQNYMSKIIRSLEETLNACGAADMLIKKRNYFAIDKTKLSCDLYDYYDGKPQGLNAFHGEYMTQYSWAENTLSKIIWKGRK